MLFYYPTKLRQLSHTKRSISVFCTVFILQRIKIAVNIWRNRNEYISSADVESKIRRYGSLNLQPEADFGNLHACFQEVNL